MILYLNTWLQSDAQVPYEDIRYEYEEWPQIKHSRRFTVFMHCVLKENNIKKKIKHTFFIHLYFNYRNALRSVTRARVQRSNAAAGINETNL